MAQSIAIVGGGVFGSSTAIELRRRGHDVELFEAGMLPRPEASSTDLSRAVRVDYGTDDFYSTLAEEALVRWEQWHDRDPGLYHPDGFLLLTRAPMSAGEFEHDSYQALSRRGYPLVRIDPDKLAHRFPVLGGAGFVDGYYNPRGGWVDAARAMAWLGARARAAGVVVHQRTPCRELMVCGTRVEGIRTVGGVDHRADQVVVAAGAWTPLLVPWIADRVTPVAQPVLYFQADQPARYRSPVFAPFGADISRTGWYGFPATDDGAVKIANHGPGLALSPDAPRTVSSEAEERCRAFLRDTLPELAEAPRVDGRSCFYCDTFDGDFWIDRDPEREGLVVAAGGSGHGFKFAPILGEIVANVVDRVPDHRAARFAWRELGAPGSEGARARER